MTESNPLFRELTRHDFLTRYWQKRPLLLRAVWPDGLDGPDLNELAGLAMEPEIESRLVREDTRQPADSPERWHLEQGPFKESTLTSLPDSHWTLLVQALDQWLPDIHRAFAAMDFLPAWRRDDIMLSGSAPGGTVGPHFDHYDVFLYQAQGRRRWQVGSPVTPDTALIAEADLNLLSEFTPLPEHDWVLEPGDVLYIPPRYGHFGVSETTGITWSFGFRSPDATDLLQGLASRLAIEPEAEFLRYADPDLELAEAGSHRLTPQALQRMRELIQNILTRDELLADWLGSFMTTNKYDLFTESVPDSPEECSEQKEPGPEARVQAALPTRCTAFDNRLYTNGRVWELGDEDQALTAALVDSRGPWLWSDLQQGAVSATAQRALTWLWSSGSLEPAEAE